MTMWLLYLFSFVCSILGAIGAVHADKAGWALFYGICIAFNFDGLMTRALRLLVRLVA